MGKKEVFSVNDAESISVWGKNELFSLAHTVHKLWFKLDDETNIKGEKK